MYSIGKGHFGIRKFYGTTKLGEKGQVVIPAEARESMNLAKGEKLLVFGMGNDTVVLSKLSHLEEFASNLEERLGDIRKIIRKTTTKRTKK